MKYLLAAALLAASPALATTTLQDAPENATEARLISYTCKDDAALDVAYMNGSDGTNFAVLAQDGKLVLMEQSVSASGEIYHAVGEGATLELMTKAGEAWLEDDGKMLLSDCTS